MVNAPVKTYVGDVYLGGVTVRSVLELRSTVDSLNSTVSQLEMRIFGADDGASEDLGLGNHVGVSDGSRLEPILMGISNHLRQP